MTSVSDWRKSSYSKDSNCTEVASLGGEVLVRDSKDPDGPRLSLTPGEWRSFVAAICNGRV